MGYIEITTSICLSFHLPFYLAACPSIFLYVHLSIYPSDFHVKNLFGVYQSLLDNPLLMDYIFQLSWPKPGMNIQKTIFKYHQKHTLKPIMNHERKYMYPVYSISVNVLLLLVHYRFYMLVCNLITFQIQLNTVLAHTLIMN